VLKPFPESVKKHQCKSSGFSVNTLKFL